MFLKSHIPLSKKIFYSVVWSKKENQANETHPKHKCPSVNYFNNNKHIILFYMWKESYQLLMLLLNRHVQNHSFIYLW